MRQLDDLINRQTQLHDRATQLIDRLKLFDVLEVYGKVRWRGSFRSETMTWPDLDASLLMPAEEITLERGIEVLGALLRLPNVRRGELRNGLDGEDGRSPVMVIHLKVLDDELLWKVDIVMVAPENETHFDWLGDRPITQQQREAALRLKAELMDRHLYPQSSKVPGSVGSLQLWQGIFNNKGNSPEEFLDWINPAHNPS